MPNRDGSKTAVTEFFGDREYTFDLVDREWKFLTELEGVVGSILPFFGRIRSGDFKAKELRETIRLALIGGGLAPSEAASRLSLYFDMTPLSESIHIAMSVTGAALFGTSEDGSVVEKEAADDGE